MKIPKELKLILFILACGIFMHFFRFDEERVATIRLDEALLQDNSLSRAVVTNCASLSSAEHSYAERYLTSKLSLPMAANGENCKLLIQSADTNRFFLRSTWSFAIQINAEKGNLLFQKYITTSFPRPLALLPLAILLFALLFRVKLPSFALLAAFYILMLGGLNLIHTMSLMVSSLENVFIAEPSFFGLALILIWLSIQKHSEKPEPTEQISPPKKKWLRFFENAFLWLVGVWNPGVFSSLGALLPVSTRRRATLSRFLDSQLLVAAVSLYLFSFEFAGFSSTILKSIALPRYFSLSIVALFLIKLRPYSHKRLDKEPLLWHRAWKALAFVLIFELAALKINAISSLPTINRIGGSLILSEIVFPRRLDLVACLRTATQWVFMLTLAFWLPLLASKTGICELALGLCDPRQHPSNFILFTFVSAMVTAFVTGSFSLTFFTFYNLIIGTNQEPAVQAAFLDGVLAGSFLSPLSIYNLIPSAQLGIPIKDLMLSRLRLLSMPIFMAIIIYAVTIPAIMILRPLVFTFLCLLVLAWELKKRHWVLPNYWPRPGVT